MLLFNRYQYQPSTDLIGKGEHTRVYKALDKEIYLPVAVKVYRGSDQAEKYGLAQVEKVIAMDHPNICRYLHVEEIEKEGAFGEKETMQVCVMELVADGDFASYYRARNQPELMRKMVTDILRGLAYLHSQGIVHRRLKASNLLVGETTQGPVVKITDFGLGSGKAALRDARLSSIVMEVTHMAPEQLNPKKFGINGKVSYHLDFWALGMAVYEALTDNDVLFRNTSEDTREQMIQNILLPHLPEKVRKLPAPFDRFVARCMAKHADDRAQNTRELLELLAEPVTAQDDMYDSMLPVMEGVEVEVSETVGVSEEGVIVENTIAQAPLATTEEEVDDRTQVLPEKMIKTVLGEDEDVTRVVMTDEKEDEDATRIIPKKTEEDVDATRVLPKEELPAIDDTKILPKNDDTMILPKADLPVASPAVPPADDDTRILPKADNVAGSGGSMRSDENHSLFNRYEYNPRTGLIGKGGFSRVYKAFDKKLNRWVALKIYKTGEFSDRYSPIAEIRRVINLDHPNICRYLDIEEIEKENAFGEKEITQICVMELLDGGNLLEYFTAHHTEKVLEKLLADVLNGLAYLHKNGIIHRDIKPANILIKNTYDGPVAKITDFGISKLNDSINNNSSSALVVSIPYMAPEQLNVKKYGISEKISYNLDLWALGVTVYEILTGKILFKNTDQDTSEQIMTNIMAPGLPEKIKELPQPFLEVVRRCVVKDARERVQRAEELVALINKKPAQAWDASPKAPEAPAERPQRPVQPSGGDGGFDPRKAPIPVTDTGNRTDTGSRARRSFSADEEEVDGKKTPQQKHERWVSGLRIAVIAAAVLLAISLYIFWQNRKMNEATNFPATKTDTPAVTTGHVRAQQPGATTGTTPATTTTTKDSSKGNPATASTANSGGTAPDAEKKPHRERREREEGEGGSRGIAGKYTLLLTTKTSRNIVINNVPYSLLESGKSMKVPLSPGNYLIQGTNPANGEVWTGRLTVPANWVNKVGGVEIP
jgi:serine/threonine protein kinase